MPFKPYFHSATFCERAEFDTVKGHSAVTFFQFRQYSHERLPLERKMQLHGNEALQYFHFFQEGLLVNYCKLP